MHVDGCRVCHVFVTFSRSPPSARCMECSVRCRHRRHRVTGSCSAYRSAAGGWCPARGSLGPQGHPQRAQMRTYSNEWRGRRRGFWDWRFVRWQSWLYPPWSAPVPASYADIPKQSIPSKPPGPFGSDGARVIDAKANVALVRDTIHRRNLTSCRECGVVISMRQRVNDPGAGSIP